MCAPDRDRHPPTSPPPSAYAVAARKTTRRPTGHVSALFRVAHARVDERAARVCGDPVVCGLLLRLGDDCKLPRRYGGFAANVGNKCRAGDLLRRRENPYRSFAAGRAPIGRSPDGRKVDHRPRSVDPQGRTVRKMHAVRIGAGMRSPDGALTTRVASLTSCACEGARWRCRLRVRSRSGALTASRPRRAVSRHECHSPTACRPPMTAVRPRRTDHARRLRRTRGRHLHRARFPTAAVAPPPPGTT